MASPGSMCQASLVGSHGRSGEDGEDLPPKRPRLQVQLATNPLEAMGRQVAGRDDQATKA